VSGYAFWVSQLSGSGGRLLAAGVHPPEAIRYELDMLPETCGEQIVERQVR
jgi:hypothetical protein